MDIDALKKLREPFPPHQISKLPKPTRAQTDEVKADFKKGIRCKECGAWHHPDVVHLDYVGHAALTDRLLDTDPAWSWEPLALHDGLPAFDKIGGLWIKLTICGVTRLGYGNAADNQNKDVGAREKEVIGDALRNAAMRFGAALDLWHKGDLHLDEEKPATTVHAPAKLALESLSDDAQARIGRFASSCADLIASGNMVTAATRYIEYDFQDEAETAAFWSFAAFRGAQGKAMGDEIKRQRKALKDAEA